MKLLLDLSSVLGAYLHLLDEEFGVDLTHRGEPWHIPDVETCMERFQRSVGNLDIKPIDFIVVKDPGGVPSCRTRILKTYKNKERSAPEEFYVARKELFDQATLWLKSQGATIATPKLAEADDLINQLAIRFPETVIWTRDKDLLACPTHVLYQDKDGIHFDPRKFPVEDQYIQLYRTLVLGDKSDNVGSCKGFGPKAWENMVAGYGEESIGELDEMFRTATFSDLELLADDFLPFQKILDQRVDLLKIYRVLSFAPVRAHTIKWEGGMLKGDDTLVTAHNFEKVLPLLRDFDYSVIDYEADSSQASKAWCITSGVKIDTLGQELTGMGLRINDQNYYFCVDHKDTNNISLDQLESVLEILWGKPIYAHNAAFENTLTHEHFGALLPNLVDTQLMANYVDENDFINLKHLSDRWLSYKQASYADTVGTRSGMREVTGNEVVGYGIDDVITTDSLKKLFEVIMQYEDTLDVFHTVEDDALYFTTLCFINGVDFDADEHQAMKIKNDANIRESWEELSEMLLDLEWPGGEFQEVKNMNIVTLNRIHKAIHGVDLGDISTVKMAIRLMNDRELAKLAEDKDYSLINDYYKNYWKPVAEFNVRSPKQMAKLLYELLGMPKRIMNKPTAKMLKAGKAGNPASNEAAISNAIAYRDTEHIDLLKLLLKHKGFLTRESLFFEKWPKYVHWKTGKIHCSMRQSSTTTRRFSHAKPNKAQLPKKKGKEVRNMMTVPDDDWYIWALDIDSQELILQSWASKDVNFLACYQGTEKKDVHALTGFEVAAKQGVDFESYDKFKLQLEDDGPAKPFRVSGKATNFATAYLCRAPKLAQMLCVTEKEAQDFIDAKAQAFPGLLPAVHKYIKVCQERGYSLTFMGARRHLAGRMKFGSRKEYEREAAGRLAWSFRIQSSGAEQIKLAAGAIYRSGAMDDGLVRGITIIHDEIVGLIHKSVLEERMPKLIDCICQPYAEMEIETSTTPEVGRHFGSLTKWELVK